ncbi:PREDICTED: U3 small nucleolar ribonucleoprotein protein MPP10-like [Priapulus caudatus]|uniref:U3 small nucleolar ribonucleoprotein protein MPP10 n=1 Tax=Priapulus caudatus TaxID=37621 RepID=A0ABM1E5S6_PRICU|nr:PREDICTED: U3 small nucleolar ribonucleoprotein protein MPP10-like [Priapulus caudatus]
MAAPDGNGTSLLSALYTRVIANTENPENYLSLQQEAADEFKLLTKTIYDFTKCNEASVNKGTDASEALPELIVDNFDDEQVWQEVELQNQARISRLLKDVARVRAIPGDLTLGVGGNDSETRPSATHLTSSETLEPDDDADSDSASSDNGSKGSSVVDKLEPPTKQSSGQIESGSDSEIDFDFDLLRDDFETSEKDAASDDGEAGASDPGSEEEEEPGLRPSKRTGRTIVDDAFFSLAEMEEFLEEEDRKEMRRSQGGSASKDDDEDVDMFQDIPSSDDDEEIKQSTRDFKYNDFFAPPCGSIEREEQEELRSHDESDGQEQEMKQIEEEESSEGEYAEEIMGGKRKDEEKSAFQKRQDRINERIAKMDEVRLAEKPWQLAGEVTASKRPENSLLQEHVEFDQTVKPAPIVTEEVTKSLEELITQRVKDQAWDDVERRKKATTDAQEYKKKVILDQEKSKLSLGEIYEQEYIKKTQAEKEEVEDPEHTAIKKMMNDVFSKLDALSNYQYNPKAPTPEIKIISNLPSITMEDVTPAAVSDATLLAPEEIKEKSGKEVKNSSEKTVTDRKRERREKKARKRARRVEKEKREKLVSKLQPGLGNKFSKDKALKALAQEGDKTTIVKDTGRRKQVEFKSSKAFFSKLQDEVTSHVIGHKVKSKSKEKKTVSASKLKL